MKKVAVLSIHSCPLAALGGKETGGMNVYVRELSREMGRKGWQVDVFTRSQNPHISRIVSLGRNARVIHLPAGPETPIPKNEILKFLPEFIKNLTEFALQNKISYELIHSHYWLSGWVGERLKEKWSLPLLHMFHTLGFLKNSTKGDKKEKESQERLKIETEIMAKADFLIASTPWEKEQMVSFNNINPAKIKVIPCGVDLKLFRPKPMSEAKRFLGLSAEKEFILFVGRIDAIKGIDILIKAFDYLMKKYIKWRKELGLIIIGGEVDLNMREENQEWQRLKKLVVRLGLQEQVAFWGPQRQDLLPYFYSAAQALILPSRYESFGMVALEAMACGTTVIATDVGGLPFTIKNGENGFLIPEGDWVGLGEKISEILENQELKNKIRKKALEKAKNFAWPIITQKVLSLYDSLINH
ncbi:MAG: glycosyltransferase [Thermodesulfobacteriota bacterium]